MTWQSEITEFLNGLVLDIDLGDLETDELLFEMVYDESGAALVQQIRAQADGLRAYVGGDCGSFIGPPGAFALNQVGWLVFCDGTWLDGLLARLQALTLNLELLLTPGENLAPVELSYAFWGTAVGFAAEVAEVPPDLENIIIPEAVKTGLEGVAGLLVLLLIVQVAGVLK